MALIWIKISYYRTLYWFGVSSKLTDNFDPTGNSYEYADFQRSILAICHSLVFCDETFQVHGVNFLMDYGSVTMKHISFGGSENMRKRAQHFQVSHEIYSVLSSRSSGEVAIFWWGGQLPETLQSSCLR